jgi:flagellar protein FlaI
VVLLPSFSSAKLRKLSSNSFADIFAGLSVNFYDVKGVAFSDKEQAFADFLLKQISKGSALKKSFDGVSDDVLDSFFEEVLSFIEVEGLRDKVASRKVFVSLLESMIKAVSGVKFVQDKALFSEFVLHSSIGLKKLAFFSLDDELEELMINSPDNIFVFHKKYGMCKTNVFVDEKFLTDLIQKIAVTVGREFDSKNALLDARLPDGSRVNATLSELSPTGATLTIRKFSSIPLTILDLIDNGTLSADAAAFLWLIADGLGRYPQNLLVAGGTASGKTTLLNVLSNFVRLNERVVSIEDTIELSLLGRENWVALEARNSVGSEVTMDSLLKNSMRMRPDRIIVGEVRGPEALTLFTAMDTGHQGAFTGDVQVQLANGNIVPIVDLADKYFPKNKVFVGDGFEYVETSGLSVVSFNKQDFSLEAKPVSRIWRKKFKGKMLNVRLKSGKNITLTCDHPLYKIDSGVLQVNAEKIIKGDFLAVPEKIPVTPLALEITQPYLAGLIYGDGHINSNAVQFVNSNTRLVKKFVDSIEEMSTHKVWVKDYGSFSRAQVWDKNLCNFFQGEYNLPFGNKTKIFQLNEKLLASSNDELALFLKGMFDCEASVNLRAGAIIFSTSNTDLAVKMPLMLLRYGINSSTYVAKKDGKGNPGPYYTIHIYGLDNIISFYYNIGFYHSKKSDKLRQLIKKTGKSTALLPNCGAVLKKIRLEAKITQDNISRKLGYTSRGVIKAYENGQRKPTKKFVSEFCKTIRGVWADSLRNLADQPINWQQVKSVKEVEYDGFVYDLTVEDNHTYIANGVIVSNCLGTIHANNAREAIIKLQERPLSVPQAMLSLLDFIVIMERHYSKEYGMQRKVTQIVELSRMEDKVLFGTLFEFDDKSALLKRTDISSQKLEEIAQKNSLTKLDLKKEIDIRKLVLQWMISQGIRKPLEVLEVIESYYYDPEKVLKTIAEFR